jgi:enoyl-CoA hydratase/carnithine racemase
MNDELLLTQDHGAGLAIAGDLAVMAQSASIGYLEIRHGLVAAIVMANPD